MSCSKGASQIKNKYISQNLKTFLGSEKKKSFNRGGRVAEIAFDSLGKS